MEEFLKEPLVNFLAKNSDRIPIENLGENFSRYMLTQFPQNFEEILVRIPKTAPGKIPKVFVRRIPGEIIT